MSNPRVTQLIPIERVEGLIHLARGEKVLLDTDLAKLYGVKTKALNQAVRRNLGRFPADFMFRLTREECATLFTSRSQSVTMNKRGTNMKYLPYAFTEQGVAMLSSVLRSERAVQVNVAIMRAFVSLRRMLAGNEALSRKLAELERRLENHDQGIKALFDAIRELMTPLWLHLSPNSLRRFRPVEELGPILFRPVWWFGALWLGEGSVGFSPIEAEKESASLRLGLSSVKSTVQNLPA